MSKRSAVFAVTAAAYLAVSAAAQPRVAATHADPAMQQIIDEERDHPMIFDTLEYISDAIGPRLTGSENLRKANDWTAQRMKEFGLANVHLEPWTFPQGWERGACSVTLTAPFRLALNAAQLAWSPGTRGTVSGTVVDVRIQSEADFAQYKGKLRNAFVLTGFGSRRPAPTGLMGYAVASPLPPIPALQKPDESTGNAEPQGRAPGAPFDFRRFQELRRKINDFYKSEGVAAVVNDAGKPDLLLNMTGSWTSHTEVTTLFLAHEQFAMLQRMIEHHLNPQLSASVQSRFLRGPMTASNTVGEIRGSEHPEQVVLIGGHLDSWDLGTGSTDNGTGSAVVLEAAHLLHSLPPPKRTIRFVLFTGEEEGLMGSKAYVEAHKAEMPSIDVVYIDDTGTGRIQGAWLQNRAEDKPMLADQFSILQGLGLLTSEPNLLPGKMNGTDHASFDDAGVPAFAFNQDSADYGLTHHSQADLYDRVRPMDLEQGACVMAIMAYDAANRPDTFPRAKQP